LHPLTDEIVNLRLQLAHKI